MPWRVGINAKAPKRTSAAIGRLTYRHQRQSTYWVRKPPRMSPKADPAMAMVA